MSSRKIKQPPVSQGDKIGVKPNTLGSTNKMKPNFSFEHLVQSHSVEACVGDDQASLSLKLSKIGAMTWSEIQSAPKHGLGHEKIEHSAIKVGLPSIVTPDVNLIAFRFSGKKPMVGFRDGQTFYLLWLDRDFTLYDHG